MKGLEPETPQDSAAGAQSSNRYAHLLSSPQAGGRSPYKLVAVISDGSTHKKLSN